MNGFTKALLSIAVTIISVLTLGVGVAGATEGPGDLQPGGNGPDDPEIPGPGIIAIPMAQPSASVAVSCTTETATVTLKNPTANFLPYSVTADGNKVKESVIGPNQQALATFDLAENESADVVAEFGNTVALSETVERDCIFDAIIIPELLPEPETTASVEVSCTSETATVTIKNPTNSFQQVSAKVDGEVVKAGTVGPNQQWIATFDLAEDANAFVEAVAGTGSLLAQHVERDCEPEPTPDPVDPPAPTPDPVEPPTPTPDPIDPPAPTPDPVDPPAPVEPEPTPDPVDPPTPTEPEPTPAPVDPPTPVEPEPIPDPVESMEHGEPTSQPATAGPNESSQEEDGLHSDAQLENVGLSTDEVDDPDETGDDEILVGTPLGDGFDDDATGPDPVATESFSVGTAVMYALWIAAIAAALLAIGVAMRARGQRFATSG